MVAIDAIRASVLTDEAQEACDLLMVTAAEHERFAATPVGWADSPASQNRSALSYVMRMVVLVEVFTFQRAIDLSDGHAGDIASPVFAHLYKTHRRQIENSWDNALAALKLWPNVAPRDYSEWKTGLRGYIIARNCWAHGHGRLTARYVHEIKSTLKHLGEAGFVVSAGQVNVEPRQVSGVARQCRAFIAKLDGETKSFLG